MHARKIIARQLYFSEKNQNLSSDILELSVTNRRTFWMCF